MKRLTLLIAAALFYGLLPRAGAAWFAGPGPDTAAFSLPVPQAVNSRRLICVDPGHPNSFNSGLEPVNGTTETRINWQVALKLESILKEKGFDVLLTRSEELQPVENKDRALMANSAGAALCVHLHCESSPGSGFTLYYPDRQGVFDYKDDPDNGFKGPSSRVIEESLVLALAVQKGMQEKLSGSLADLGVKGDSATKVGSNQGALTFSIFSKIPTLTIEMAVLTDKHDAAFIKSEEGQEKMAQAIAAGIQLHQAR